MVPDVDDRPPSYRGRRVFRFTILADVEVPNATGHPSAKAMAALHTMLSKFNTENAGVLVGLVCLNDGSPVVEAFDIEAHERARETVRRHIADL
jgi:hypothetical protein